MTKSSFNEGMRLLQKDGYNDGFVNVDIDEDALNNHTSEQIAKEARKETSDPEMLRASGYLEAVSEYSQNEDEANRLINAYLNSFESGVKEQATALKKKLSSES